MRLPRVRFTVGSLLLTVAVVAANCGYLRFLYEMSQKEFRDLLWTAPLSLSVGFLPLLNVAVIGILLFVARRLQSILAGRAETPTPSPAGGTFFSLHFLMMGWLVSRFMPNAIVTYLTVTLAPIANYWDYIVDGCNAVFGSIENGFAEVALEFSIMGVLISGPLLLLSWIGQKLARRCAATLPRRRFLAMTCLVSLGFAGVALAIGLTPQPFEDKAKVVLDFQVVDKNSGQPIRAAFLRMTDAFSRETPNSIPPQVLTDAGGRARLAGEFETSGQRNAFLSMGCFSTWGRWLEVSAAGYRTVRIPLPEVLGPDDDLSRPRVAKVALVTGKTPEDAFRDIAGTYGSYRFSGFLNHCGGSYFEISRDGRFAWVAYGGGSDIEEYGYFKRHDGEIELVVVPRPGQDTHPLMNVKLRTVEWGDRMYISEADDRSLLGFCRAALTPYRLTLSNSSFFQYLRNSDREKPQTGLPRLPSKVWMKFLLAEISLSNKEGSVRLALESLISRSFIKRSG